ncbi:MAG TPA: hypothetical protein VMI35_09665 [Puia sp.]|nr:hypothetical protein [Puia sp.]
MKEKSDDRVCLVCEKPIKGRADKKFCDDYCRSNYNNRLNSDASLYVRNINGILRRNRRILESLIPPDDEKAWTSRNRLQQNGFNFSVFTGSYRPATGNRYYCCYEFSYLPVGHDRYLLTRHREERS